MKKIDQLNGGKNSVLLSQGIKKPRKLSPKEDKYIEFSSLASLPGDLHISPVCLENGRLLAFDVFRNVADEVGIWTYPVSIFFSSLEMKHIHIFNKSIFRGKTKEMLPFIVGVKKKKPFPYLSCSDKIISDRYDSFDTLVLLSKLELNGV